MTIIPQKLLGDVRVDRPLLRYFGGKWQMRHWIISHFPEHRFYAEPFAGAASVLLAKPPSPDGEIINDLNGDVINLFRVMQNAEQSAELMRKLDWTPYAAAELKLSQEASTDPVERSRRMLIRSFMGIEVAGVKAKKSGLRMGNVTLSTFDQAGKRTFRNCARDWNNWKDALPSIRKRLGNVMIYQKDALDFIRLMDSGECLQYIDPPYHHATRSSTRYAVDFDKHAELIKLLLESQSMFVVSGYDSPDYQPLLDARWTMVTKESRANMSLERRTECIWISPSASSTSRTLL